MRAGTVSPASAAEFDRYKVFAETKPIEAKPPPPLPQPPPERPPSSPRHRVCCTVRRPDPDADEGRGLYLVSTLADDVEVVRRGDRTVVRAVKRAVLPVE